MFTISSFVFLGFLFKIKFLILLFKPSLACLVSSSSGELLSKFPMEGKIGFDFFGLKLNLKWKL